MKKVLPLMGFLLLGCGDHPTLVSFNPWKQEKILHVSITVNKYEFESDCTEKGGTWIKGNTRNIENAIVGCIEHTITTSHCLKYNGQEMVDIPCGDESGKDNP